MEIKTNTRCHYILIISGQLHFEPYYVFEITKHTKRQEYMTGNQEKKLTIVSEPQ